MTKNQILNPDNNKSGARFTKYLKICP